MKRSSPVPWTARLVPRGHRDAVVGDALEETHVAGPPGWRSRWRFHQYVIVAAVACWRQRIVEALLRRPTHQVRSHTMRGFTSDIRYALRSLRRAPGFVLVGVGTLALGIAGVTAMYTLLYGVMIRPLAYDRAEEILILQTSRQGETFPALAKPDLNDLRTTSQSLSTIGVWRPWQVTIQLPDGTPSRAFAASVDSRYFALLGVVPVAGRLFTTADDAPDHEPVVVLSHGYWRTHFGEDVGIIGTSIELEDNRYTVVGVAPPGFTDPLAASAALFSPPFWRASPAEFATDNRTWRSFWALARPVPDVSFETVRAELTAIARDLENAWPASNAEITFAATPLREHLVGANRSTIVLLTAAVALVLLIACANVAGLLLTRGTSRAREHGVRRALGADRARVARPLFVEHGLLAMAGLTFGLGGAWLLTTLAQPWTRDLAALVNIHLDLPVLISAGAIGLLVTVFVGIIPIWQAVSPGESRMQQGPRTVGAPGHRLRQALVIGQTVLAVVVLTGAGFLLQNFRRVQQVDLGFNTTGTLVADITPSAVRYASPAALDAFVASVVDRVASAPGVAAAGIVSDLPLTGEKNSGWLTRPDRPLPPTEAPPSAFYRTVQGDYFRAAGIALRDGRGFDDRDDATSPSVAVINEAAAALMYPDEDALGGSVRIMGQTREVIGIVSDVREDGPTAAVVPAVFVPFTQEGQEWATRTSSIFVAVETGAAADYLGTLRQTVLALDETTAIDELRTMADIAAFATRPLRVRTTLLSAFAAVATILAAVGLGGLVAYQVADRRPELSLRMALGGTAPGVVKLLVRQAVRLSAIGVGIGLAVALGAGRAVESLIPGVRSLDPVVLLVVPLLFLLAATVAAFIPAVRAARYQPADALKE